MPPIVGNLIVIALLAAVVALAIRSLWKDRRNGTHCTGDCSCCGGCHGSGHSHEPERGGDR